jgi:hypothetical protein
VPLDVSTLPVVPAATVDKAVPPELVIATEFPVNDDAPVPPLATGKVPVTAVVKSACPEVFTLLAN